MTLWLREEFARAWAGRDPFAEVEKLQGKVYRELDGRRTLQFEFAGRSYFLKLHRGIGWGEIAKNLLQLRLPVIGARNEWEAIAALERLGVDTMTAAGFGARGRNPARQLSFIITEDLADTTSLEDYCADWARNPPPPRLKRHLINRVAAIARTLHGAGINHRDFYICHFLLPNSADPLAHKDFPLHVIDLHRAQRRARIPPRWQLKDLAGLYFSVMELNLSPRDLLRFMHVYSGGNIRRWIAEHPQVWRSLQRKADQLWARKQRYGDAL
jgi:heptose I phosphotransferase